MGRSRPARDVPWGFLSPAVRRLAAERGIDPEQVTGRGAGGRVTCADLELAATAGHAAGSGRSKVIPFDAIRRRTAGNLTRAKATAAHAFVCRAADYTEIDRARRASDLTALPYVARAAIDALADFPMLNATFDGDALHSSGAVHLGIAVDLAHRGLVVPVLHHADDYRVPALARRIGELATRARARQLTPDDVAGGTFTLTNPGAAGTYVSVPIVNVPQVAILATDGVTKRVVARSHGIAIRSVGTVGLSFDARVVEPGYAAGFLDRLVEALHTPG